MSYQDVVSPSLPGGLQSRLPQLHHMVEPWGRPMLGTPLVCVGPGTNKMWKRGWNTWFFGFISSQHQKRAPKELKCKRFDSLGLLHGSPLHIVVDVLGSFQPLAQLGRGVVHVVVRRCPETETEGEKRVKGHLTRAAGWRCARTHAWTLFHRAERKVWSDAAEEWVSGLYLTFWLQARDLQHSSNYRLTRRPAASRAVKLPPCLI